MKMCGNIFVSPTCAQHCTHAPYTKEKTVEVEYDPPKCNVPWWDAGDCPPKAYREGDKGPEEALGIIEGPKGIALAVFPDGPTELPGLTNAALKALQTKGDAEVPEESVLKRPASKETAQKTKAGTAGRGVLKRPASKETFKLPKGWKIIQTVRDSGKTKGNKDTYYVAPCGKKCRSPNDVTKYLATKVKG